MQVWMITGDKQETAINIAVACKLVHHIRDILIINAHQSEEAARERLQEALRQCQSRIDNVGAASGRGAYSVKARLCPALVARHG